MTPVSVCWFYKVKACIIIHMSLYMLSHITAWTQGRSLLLALRNSGRFLTIPLNLIPFPEWTWMSLRGSTCVPTASLYLCADYPGNWNQCVCLNYAYNKICSDVTSILAVEYSYTAKIIFHQSPTKHSDYTVIGQWQGRHLC